MNTTQYVARVSFTTIVAGCAWLLAASGARAQPVHQCQVAGHAVFQNSPCQSDVRIAMATPATPTAAPPDGPAAAVPRKKSLADLLRARDGADRTRPAVREFQGDGANVLKARMGAY